MGCTNTQVGTWQCWGDPSDQGNAAAGLCFFHFIQCLRVELNFTPSSCLWKSPSIKSSLILSQFLLALGEVAVSAQLGSVCHWPPLPGLRGREGAQPGPPLALGCLGEPGETPERGKSSLLVLHGRALPSRSVCSWRRGGPAPSPIFLENGTSYIVVKPDVFQGC